MSDLKSKCGTTHYQGCECHEALWLRRLNQERSEIVELRAHLAEKTAALDVTTKALKWIAMDHDFESPSEFEHALDIDMKKAREALSHPAILKRQKELDAMEKVIYLCQTHKVLEPGCGCDICNALSELDAVRGGK